MASIPIEGTPQQCVPNPQVEEKHFRMSHEKSRNLNRRGRASITARTLLSKAGVR